MNTVEIRATRYMWFALDRAHALGVSLCRATPPAPLTASLAATCLHSDVRAHSADLFSQQKLRKKYG